MQGHQTNTQYTPIRINFNIPDVKLQKDSFQKGVQAAADYFKDRVKVRRRSVKYALCDIHQSTSICYCNYPPCDFIPPDHFADACSDCIDNVCHSGHSARLIDTDLMIYVTRNPWCERYDDRSSKGPQAVTYPCLYKRRGRPIAAHLEVNCLQPDDSSLNVAEVFIHELMHALGFRDDIFDQLGLLSRLKAWKIGHDFLRKEIVWLTGDMVKQEARLFFNCPDLVGLPLDLTSQSPSHWPSWLMPYDAINPIAEGHYNLSSISLAALADTGWYEVDITKVSHLFEGLKRKGCAFVMKAMEVCEGVTPYYPDKACRAYSAKGTAGLYEAGRCSDDRKEQECCYEATYGCSYFVPCRGYLPCDAQTTSDTNHSMLLETIGDSSRCFELDLPRWDNPRHNVKLINYPTACYRHICLDGKLSIELDAQVNSQNRFLECPNKGGLVQFKAIPNRTNYYLDPSMQITGSIYCPPYESICADASGSHTGADTSGSRTGADSGDIGTLSPISYLFGVIIGPLSLIVIVVMLVLALRSRRMGQIPPQQSPINYNRNPNAPPMKVPVNHKYAKVSKHGVKFVKTKKMKKVMIVKDAAVA